MKRLAAAALRLVFVAAVFVGTLAAIYGAIDEPIRVGFTLMSALVVSAICAVSALVLVDRRHLMTAA